jgi:hypothetical protein
MLYYTFAGLAFEMRLPVYMTAFTSIARRTNGSSLGDYSPILAAPLAAVPTAAPLA